MGHRSSGTATSGRKRRSHEEQERFIHLVRLSWDLHVLGVPTMLVLPVKGQPILEVSSATGTRIRITVIRRAYGWMFTWRPWWSRLWRRGEWVWAEADNAADMVASAVSG